MWPTCDHVSGSTAPRTLQLLPPSATCAVPPSTVEDPHHLPTGVAIETIEIEMEKRRLLPRGHEKKPTKRTGKNRRGFSKTGLAKYLKADSHLYAPLVARSPSDPSPSETLQSFDEEVKDGRPSKVKEKRLLEKIVEYLKSDSYMYAPLIDVDSISPAPASGLHHQVEKVTVAASRTAMTVKEITGRQLPEGSVPESSVPEHLGLGHSKTMKHTVYHNCRTSSSSGPESMSRELRRLVG